MTNSSTTNETDPSSEDSSGRSRARRLAAAGVAVGALGGAAIGLLVTLPTSTSAATTPTTTPATTVAPDSTTATTKPGNSTGPTDEERLADRTAKIREQLQALVDDGTITATQADAVAATLAAAGPMGDRHGPGGRGGPGGPKMGAVTDELAAVLGLDDAAALREQLKAGKSLADIATANGVPVETVKSFLRTEAETRIADAVEAGKLTQEEADAKLAELDDHLDAIIDGTIPMGGRGRHQDRPATDGTTPDGATSDGGSGAADTSLDA